MAEEKAVPITQETRDAKAFPTSLEIIADQIEQWLEWDKIRRDKENVVTDDGTQIMSLPVPYWPTHGMFKAWVEVLRSTSSTITNTTPNSHDQKDTKALLRRVRKAVLGAIHEGRLPYERQSAGRDDSGVALTLQRQRRWTFDCVALAMDAEINKLEKNSE